MRAGRLPSSAIRPSFRQEGAELSAGSLRNDEDARAARVGRSCPRSLQRAGAPGLRAASAGICGGNAARLKLPEGDDCSAKIARYRAVQDNDLSMGHVVPSVYN